MESLRKINDPNLVRLACAGADRTGDEQYSQDGSVPQSAALSGTGTAGATNVASGGIDACDLLSYFYSGVGSFLAVGVNDPSPHLEFIDLFGSQPGQPGGVQALNEAARNDRLTEVPIDTMGQSGANLAEAAELLGLDRRSVLGLITIGQLEAATDERGQVIIIARSLQAYVQKMGLGNCLPISKPEPGTATFDCSVSQEMTVQEPPLQASSFDQMVTASEPVGVTETPASPPRIDVHELASKLAQAQSQLESASYRIGFLEAELATSEQKIRIIPDIQMQESRLTALERENSDLRRRLEMLERSPFGLIAMLFSIFTGQPPRRNFTQQDSGQSGPEPQHYYYRRTRREFY